MDKWLKGWMVDSLETVESYRNYLTRQGFKEITYIDATAKILPTSKYLYYCSIPGLIFGKILHVVGLRSEIQMNNIVTAYYQYGGLKRKLWKYGIFSAEK